MGKYLLYLGSPGDLSLIRDTFKDSRISSLSDYEEIKNSNSETPDALIVVAQKIDESFLNQLHNLRLKFESNGIPLLVTGNNLSNQEKINLVEHGADDWFNPKSNIDDLYRWIDFLKLSKRIENEKKVVEVEDNSFKVHRGKRLFDIVSSFIALVLLSPIMTLIAIAIKLESKGPVIYSSKRAGRGYKVFDFFKFRTMRVGADAELAKLNHLNQYNNAHESEHSVFVKLKNDPRITRVGNFLRNTSLDELPQLANVLIGDMSIVGNRPLPLYEAQMLTKDRVAMRFIAPAGITGLWQVTKRGKKDLSEEERIALDIEYANNHSLKNNMVIVLKTIPALTQEVAV